MALKTEVKSKTKEIVDKAKKYFVTQVLKFQPEKMCLCTLVYEGTDLEVEAQQKTVGALLSKYSAFRAGMFSGGDKRLIDCSLKALRTDREDTS